MALILVIDDDGVARDAFRTFLSRKGHEVAAAADGREGVRLFRERVPDLVILDRNLPELSGSGVFAAIRELSAETPVLVVSGYDAPEDADRYMKMGAAGFLSKGGGLTPVLEAVDGILAGETATAAPAVSGPGRPKRDAAGGRDARRGMLRDISFAALGLALASAGFYLLAPGRGARSVTESPRAVSVAPVPAGPAASRGETSGAAAPVAPSSSEELLRRAMVKYGDRPVVAEFLTDLEKDPEAAAVLAGAIGKDPASALAELKRTPGAERLALKYLARPDFISLMMEVRKDPEIAPLFGGEE
ncbi:MAG: response regulator [Elusimicrobiota bacterium]